MGSARPTDRSIGEATFLPQWMKGKSDTRFDYSDSAFSPPADDTFFLIRYPKPAVPSSNAADANKEGFRSISDFLAGKRDPAPGADTQAAATASGDLSKPTSFQQYASFGADKASEPKLIIANKPKIIKTASDEFSCDKAEAGRSIVTVASQIMFGKSITSSTINTSSSSSETTQQQSSIESSDQQKEQMKKVSKSLPATPLTSPSVTPDSSPKSRRRAYGNRFFTGAFVPDGERHKNGWLLGSILGQSRELLTPKIPEEEDELTSESVPARALNRKKSISSQNLTYLGQEDKPNGAGSASHILKAQPSELREMNFWSPTSM